VRAYIPGKLFSAAAAEGTLYIGVVRPVRYTIRIYVYYRRRVARYYSKRVNDRRRTSDRDYHANEMGVGSKRVAVFGRPRTSERTIEYTRTMHTHINIRVYYIYRGESIYIYIYINVLCAIPFSQCLPLSYTQQHTVDTLRYVGIILLLDHVNARTSSYKYTQRVDFLNIG